jgi:P27 family predicted phage terminase small subunit
MKGKKPPIAEADAESAPKRCPQPPAWLPEQARIEWRRVVPDLHRRKLLGQDMLATLEAYCVAAGQVREMESIMAKEGRITTGRDGPKAHPAFGMQQKALREARLLATELGLTPHRRGTGGAPAKPKAGRWADDLLS